MAGIKAKELAEKLGLSPSAVSLALNGRPGVSSQTRERVLEAAMQMGYAKKERLGNIRNGKMICFVRYEGSTIKAAEHTSFSAFVLKGVEARASELGYTTQVRYLNAGDIYNRQSLEFIRNAAGVVFLGTDLTKAQIAEMDLFFAQMENCPVVIVDNFLFSDRVDTIGNDSFGGAMMATRYLINQGCRSIGYVKAKQRVMNFQEREAGVLQALQNAKMKLAGEIPVDVSAEGAYADFDAYLKKGDVLPQGLFVDNDIIASVVMRLLKLHGYRVPEDVSVIGFDDIPMSQMLDPPLSTVRLAKEELGTVAMDHLHNRIMAEQVPHRMTGLHLMKTMLTTRLVPRSSTKW